MSDIPDGFAGSNYRKALEIHFDPIENVFEFAPDNHFLEFVKHAKKIDENYKAQIDQIKEQIRLLETELLQNQNTFEEKLLKMSKTDPELFQQAITKFSKEQVEGSLEMIK